MLKNQSGDLVNQLQAKINQLIKEHDEKNKALEAQHASAMDAQKTHFEKLVVDLTKTHEAKVREVEETKAKEFNAM